MTRRRLLAPAGIAIAIAALMSLGSACSLAKPTTQTTGTGATGGSSTSATLSTGTTMLLGNGVGLPSSASIPKGRTYTTSTEGHPSYTFREIWRRAIVEAQKWDPDAFLVQAFARDMNSEGVPSEWTLYFARQSDGAYQIAKMDPWGNVTSTQTFASGAKSSWHAVPIGVIDSDTVAKLGTQRFIDLNASGFSRQQVQLDWATSQPVIRWSYIVLDGSSHKFLGEVMNALTGEHIERKTYPVY